MANYPFASYQQMPYGQYQQPFTATQQPFANQAQNNFQAQNFTPAATIQPQQAVPAQCGLMGRIVGSDQEITANEVPNDGNIGYFPSADGSRIYAKTWTGDGRINTIVYEKQAAEATTEPETSPYDVVIERLERIEAAVADLKPKPARSRKAASDDE